MPGLFVRGCEQPRLERGRSSIGTDGPVEGDPRSYLRANPEAPDGQDLAKARAGSTPAAKIKTNPKEILTHESPRRRCASPPCPLVTSTRMFACPANASQGLFVPQPQYRTGTEGPHPLFSSLLLFFKIIFGALARASLSLFSLSLRLPLEPPPSPSCTHSSSRIVHYS